MSSSEVEDDRLVMGRISLIVPVTNGHAIDGSQLSEYVRELQNGAGFDEVEVILATGGPRDPRVTGEAAFAFPDDIDGRVKHVRTLDLDWSSVARAGMSMATSDLLLVLDPKRSYAVDDMRKVLAPVHSGETSLAVAVPGGENRTFGPRKSSVRLALRSVSRTVLGSSDVFSGLYVVRRSVWDRVGEKPAGGRYNLLLDLLRRRPIDATDVAIDRADVLGSSRPRIEDVRQLKHLLDARFGSFSRLIQFCVVGASGMVVDLSFYALFQWLLSFTRVATLRSTLFGFSWELAIARALSISIALVWNFSMNRRLTFNDARKQSWFRQFFAYALSNGLAVTVNYGLGLYLPMRVTFFAQHRLAAAVVGIVAGTGISFPMSRWIVFSRRNETPAPAPTLASVEG